MDSGLSKILKTISFVIAIMAGATPVHPLAAGPTGLVIVLDASNSMWGKAGDTHKIVLARNGLHTLLMQQPETSAIGLVTYGNHRKSACNDINVIASPGEMDAPALSQKINSIAPYGRSPISAALGQAANLLDGSGDILLVSDGPESCGGDPCATAEHLKTTHPDIHIHVLSLQDTENSSLRCLAETSGGRFARIQDAGQFAGQLRQTLQTTEQTHATPPDKTSGILRLSAGANGHETNLPASFLIYSGDGDYITEFTARTEASQPLPPGDYQVSMLWKTIKQVKTIHINPGQTIDQHFDLGPMGTLLLEAQGSQQQAVDANFTLYSPADDYLSGHLFKSKISDTLPIGSYRIKASFGKETQEARLEVTADAETSHTFQFSTLQ